MKSIFLFIIIYSFSSLAQTHHIDSINSIPHNKLIEDLKKSVEIFGQNIKDAKKLKYEKGIADANARLAIVQYYLKNVDKGVESSIKAIKFYEENKELAKVAEVYADIGYAIKDINLQKGLYYFRKSLKITRDVNLGKIQEKIYNNYGTLQKLNGSLDSAIFYHKKSYEVAKQYNYTAAIPYSLNNLATIYSLQGKFTEAFKLLDESDQYRKVDQKSIGWADNLCYRADIYFDKKEFSNAAHYYEQSLILSKKYNFSNLTKFNLQRLAACYEALDNISKALFYQKAYQTFKDSVETLEQNVLVNRLQEEFESAKKDKEIAEKNEQIQASELKNQKSKSRNILLLGSIAILLLLTYFIYTSQKTKQKKLKTKLELEQANHLNKIQQEKLRISRDLHDNIGSQLTYVISSMDNLSYVKDEDKRKQRLDELANFTKTTMQELRETIWTIKANEITLQEFMSKVSALINQLKKAHPSLKFSVEQDNSNYMLKSNEAMQIYRILQEAINNSLKYAQASEIKVKQSNLKLLIIDNGIGFNTTLNSSGNGLHNMKTRAEEIGVNYVLKSYLDEGTTIELSFNK